MPKYIYGAPYDPTLRTTEHGKNLYNIWRRIRKCPHCKEWDYFPTFYEWAMQSGYVFGARILKIDDRKPFDPENCAWPIVCECEYDEEWAARFTKDWNESVNRIRKHYEMPPLEGTVYGD